MPRQGAGTGEDGEGPWWNTARRLARDSYSYREQNGARGLCGCTGVSWISDVLSRPGFCGGVSDDGELAQERDRSGRAHRPD